MLHDDRDVIAAAILGVTAAAFIAGILYVFWILLRPWIQ